MNKKHLILIGIWYLISMSLILAFSNDVTSNPGLSEEERVKLEEFSKKTGLFFIDITLCFING